MAKINGVLTSYIDENGNKIGIDNYEVAQTIGVPSSDYGKLCTGPSINKWSYWKPLHLDNFARKLTIDKLKEGNFGLDTSIDTSKAIHTQVEIGKSNLVMTLNSQFTDDELREGTLWRYEVPALHTGFGRPAGKKFKDAGYLSRYRLSDFNGYYHAARPLVKMTDSFKQDADGNYNVELEISSDEYGITYKNFNPLAHAENTQEWNMIGWHVNVFIVSDHTMNTAQSAVYGVGALNGMGKPFASFNDGTLEDKITISFPKSALAHLMGTWYICVLLTSEEVRYEKGQYSFNTGTNNFYIAYPEIQANAVGKKAFFVENALMRVDFPDGANSVLWEQIYEGESGIIPQTSYFFDGKLMSTLQMDNYVSASTSGHIRFSNTEYGISRGFEIALELNNVESIIKRAYRSIVFFSGDPYIGTLGRRNENNYLSFDYNTSGNTENTGTYYKPLLKGLNVLDMANGSMVSGQTVDFYLRYTTTNGVRHQDVIMNFNGNESVIFTTKNNNSMFIGQVEFQNMVTTRTNKPEGFRMMVYFGGANSNNVADNRHPYRKKINDTSGVAGMMFRLSTNTNENENTGVYGEGSLIVNNRCPFISQDYSIDCRLPSNKNQSGNGGNLYVLYDVTMDLTLDNNEN